MKRLDVIINELSGLEGQYVSMYGVILDRATGVDVWGLPKVKWTAARLGAFERVRLDIDALRVKLVEETRYGWDREV